MYSAHVTRPSEKMLGAASRVQLRFQRDAFLPERSLGVISKMGEGGGRGGGHTDTLEIPVRVAGERGNSEPELFRPLDGGDGNRVRQIKR